MKYIIIALLTLTACTKEYKAPVIFDLTIKHSLNDSTLTLEAVSYPAGLTHKWYVNDEFFIGQKVAVRSKATRFYIQLAVIDAKGNSQAEYLTVTR